MGIVLETIIKSLYKSLKNESLENPIAKCNERKIMGAISYIKNQESDII